MISQEQAKTLLRKIIEERWTSMDGLDALSAYIAPNFIHHRSASSDTNFEVFRQGAAFLLRALPDLQSAVYIS